jgi:hypothetical protein
MSQFKHRPFLLVAILLVLAPVSARAGFTLAGSVGKSFRLSPTVRGEPTTLMVSPGFAFTDLVRAEVGFAVSLPDLAGGSVPAPVDIQIRPSLVLDPPVFPLYLRVFAIVSSLINGVHLLPGAAVGLDFAVGPVSLFVEVGALTRFLGSVEFMLEPRAGVIFKF